MQTKIQRWLISGLAVAILVLTGCTGQTSTPAASAGSPTASPSTTPTTEAISSPATGPKRLEGKATVELIVKGAPIKIEVDGVNAPITAGNFVDLVERKVYDGLVFHRVVREPEPFVVQGGDPQGKNPNFPVERLGTGGFIDPATSQERQIPLEIVPDQKDAKPIYGKTFQEAGITAPPKLKHTRGAVAMARSQLPDSASSQFYITLADLKFLDGNYAVFGYVTEGMDVVDKIQTGDRIESMKIIQATQSPKPSP
jgi:peptidyl-prolyl cis-trans isomerase B (cyclophilin B)